MQYLPRHRKGQEKMICDGQELEALIDRYVNGKKAARNREILKEYYINGRTYEQAAEMFDMSPMQVCRIVHKYGDPILLMLRKG